MDSSRKRSRPSYGARGSSYGYGAYGYGSTGYGYGYGYPGYGSAATTVEKTIQDYMMIVRERIWYIVIGFLLVFGAVAIYTFTRVPLYAAYATVEIFRRAPTVLQTNQSLDSEISSEEDLNTQVNVLESEAIIQGVAAQITGPLRDSFLAPYRERDGSALPVARILHLNRTIEPQRLSYIIAIQYRHPDRTVAATVANLFADEYIAYNEKLRIAQSMEAVDELRRSADEQRSKVDGIAAAIQAYREKNNLVSLDQRKDIVTEALKDLDKDLTDSSAVLSAAETNWRQVEDCQRTGTSFLTLSFIANNPAVTKLVEDVADQKVLVAQLSERYRAKHPRMLAAMASLQAAEAQLKQAVQTCTDQVKAQYETALDNYRKAQSALAAQESDSLRLDRFGLEYSNLERDYLENEKILDQILASQLQEQQSSSGTLQNEIARILDRATPPLRSTYPRYKLILTIGAAAGLTVGVALAFFVAFNDDRIKSAFDIESFMGLPLVGILPNIRKMRRPEEMQGAADQTEPQSVQDAFASVLSTLRLKDESKQAQCILVTSTIAGEGKTFISTRLAETYGAHGERVLVLDCDLRRPAVNRVFNLENLKGIIDVCESSAGLDDVIIQNVRPNMDVILTGGRAKNPSGLLNGKAFAVALSELRKRYDRIFIDTPPIGIVSDAFIILPMIDGALYAVFFNKVRRKAAQYCAQRLLEVNVPVFGAIINGLPTGIGSYYYSRHYGAAYQHYYTNDGATRDGVGQAFRKHPPRS